jgi:hypothetical protein
MTAFKVGFNSSISPIAVSTSSDGSTWPLSTSSASPTAS